MDNGVDHFNYGLPKKFLTNDYYNNIVWLYLSESIKLINYNRKCLYSCVVQILAK